MQLNNKYNLIYFMMTMSSLMMISSSDPMIMWMWMEITNMLFIINILNTQTNNISMAMTMMIIQFSGSTLILVGMLGWSSIMVESGMIIKLGLFPFHSWMPMITSKLNWYMCLILMTIMKMPPFMFTPLLDNWMLVMSSAAMTVLMLTFKLMFTQNPKLIMGMSSSIHSSWMLVAANLKLNLWMIYFMLYSANTLLICSMMNKPMSESSNTAKIFSLMILFSNAGIPPTIGFIGKTITMMNLNYKLMIIMVILIISSALSMIFYSRLFLKQMYSSHPKIKLIKPFKSPFKYYWMMIMMMMIM